MFEFAQRISGCNFRCYLPVVLFTLLTSFVSQAAQLPPSYVNSVVALGCIGPTSTHGEPPHPDWITEGTGFFYGYLTVNDPDPTKRRYEIYLVTAGHVVREHIENLHSDLNVRLNAKDSSKGVQEFTIPNNPAVGEGTWFFHPDQNIDVAAVRVNLDFLKSNGFEPDFFTSDLHTANIGKLKDLEVSAGDGIFVLGYPMNLAGEQRNYVIVREGVIARISEMLDGASKTFMLDALVFPGNSGSPVVLKPEPFAIQGTKNQTSAYLIGIVLDYIPYTDTAISAQTRRPRIIFEENSGLTGILPVDYIDQAIQAQRTAFPRNIPPRPPLASRAQKFACRPETQPKDSHTP